MTRLLCSAKVKFSIVANPLLGVAHGDTVVRVNEDQIHVRINRERGPPIFIPEIGRITREDSCQLHLDLPLVLAAP